MLNDPYIMVACNAGCKWLNQPFTADEMHIESNYWTIRLLSIIGSARGDHVARATTDPLHLFARATVEPCDRFADSHCRVSTPKRHVFIANELPHGIPLYAYRRWFDRSTNSFQVSWPCKKMTMFGGMFEGDEIFIYIRISIEIEGLVTKTTLAKPFCYLDSNAFRKIHDLAESVLRKMIYVLIYRRRKIEQLCQNFIIELDIAVGYSWIYLEARS